MMTMNRHRQHNAPKQQKGFTLFEIVVVVLLIGILMTFAIDRMLRLQIAAERVSVQQVIAALQSAVNLEAAELVVSKGLNSIRTFENSNPMNYLTDLPYNYIGEMSDNISHENHTNSWYFDAQQHTLVYIVKNVSYFETSVSGTPRIRLQVVPVYKDNDHGRAGKIRGITIKSLDTYSWK